MNDTLREAIEKFASEWEAMTGNNSYVSEELRTILAAHTVTVLHDGGVA